MTPEQWTRVKDIFNAALDHEAAARRAFVLEASGGDEDVRLEVERLLDAQADSAAFIEQPAASTLLSGRVIGHYEIGRLLGMGGMGHVYAARDTELGREVALKVASFDSDDAQARLRREAQHASRLSHPHICHVYEVGRADGQLFVVMELVAGRSLADLVREGPLSIPNARRYGTEIADALAHAHEHGVTHRDLKSTNVMITPKRGAKVLDFGLARTADTHQLDALSRSQRSLTNEGMIAGTLPYMAPELLRGQRGDHRSDIWALGVLMYEMLTGGRPFTGATGFEVSAGILHQPAALPPSVPASMRAIVHRCLEKSPDKRYQQAADVQSALEDMKGMDTFPRLRIPYSPRRLLRSPLLFVFGIAAAALVVYGIRAGIRSPMVSNAYGYSLLESGAFEQAVEQFEGLARREATNANAWDSLGEGYLANGMPAKALDAYSRALAIEPNFEPSNLGRGVALAALGRYDEALRQQSPDFRVQAFLLSRVGRYREAKTVLDEGRRASDDAEVHANTSLTLAWLLIERKQHEAAIEQVRAAETALLDRPKHTLLMLADLIGGIADLRAGNMSAATSRLTTAKSRLDTDERIEVKWVAALEGEIALAQGQHDLAASSFRRAESKAWQTLGRDASSVFALNPPSRDGLARVEMAKGNVAGAIEEYRRLTTVRPTPSSSAGLEPRHILELARLLQKDGDETGAREEYGRFVSLWSNADPDLPELQEAREVTSAAEKLLIPRR